MKDNRENIRLINTQRNELKTDLIINVTEFVCFLEIFNEIK